jgi:hypothetical protein
MMYQNPICNIIDQNTVRMQLQTKNQRSRQSNITIYNSKRQVIVQENLRNFCEAWMKLTRSTSN